ncbi:hypothetical protein [Bacillus fonticola]|uniref:hypothetical protein n=1 Tax=Bacillus fonticola TaxID=2728853 RepID=UPI001474941C|nr:hypothetical protein [Bacillus fonticola]
MAKRKAERDQAYKSNKTPYENKRETEFSTEYAQGEEAIKGANRNSKQGRKNRS